MTAPTLHDADVRARITRSRVNLSVTAGAGTGKTTLLVDSVLARLLLRDLDVRRLLMLTFTEKAANEMRLRLGAKLRALADPPDAAWRQERARWEAEGADVAARTAAALAGLDRAEIGTLHSFCAHVLREHPIEAGVDPGFVVDEGPQFDAMFDREWERWLERELVADSPRREEWLKVFTFAKLDDLRDAARELASYKVPDEALEPGPDRRAVEALARLREENAVALATMAKACSEGDNRLRVQLESLASWFRTSGLPVPEFLDGKPSEQKKGWPDLDEATRIAKEGWRVAKLVRAVDPGGSATAFALLADFARAFRRRYTALGYVSFDGLLARTRSLLLSKEFPEIRARLKAKYAFIVVDEFQDTDPVQCEILLLLAEAGHAPSTETVRLAPDRLMIVGDPKQSIYSFRGADIVAYERVQQRIAAQQGGQEVLRTNFRSHGGIIGSVNAIFSRLITKAGELQPDYEEIRALEDRRATRPSQETAVVLARRDDGKNIKSDESRTTEAAWIAARLKESIGRMEIPDVVGDRPLKYGDVAILFRSLTSVHHYLDALRSAGIPYVVEGEKYYYGTPEVIDTVNLLRAVADPHDRVAVAGLLRSPLGAIDDRRLYAMRKELDYRIGRPGEPSIFAVLRRLHAASRVTGVPDLIDRVYAETGLLDLAAASKSHEQAVANILKIRQTAEALDRQGGVTLPRLLAILRENIDDLEEEGESPLADETLDAVRILSIHKAKGLEFPVVILPDLHHQFQVRGDKTTVRFDGSAGLLGMRLGRTTDAGWVLLKEQERVRQDRERRRQLYVAMTRARESMILMGSSGYAPDSFLGLLEEAVPELAGDSGELRIGGTPWRVDRPAWRDERPRARAVAKRAVPRAAWKALAAAWRARRKDCERVLALPRFTSPSRLQEKRQVVATRDDLERMERGAAVGTLCHRVLESLDFAKPELAGLVERHADDPAVAKEAAAVLAKFLKAPAFKAIAATKVLARELPFMMKSGESILQGAIDLVIQEGKRVVVVDWKSNKGGATEQSRGDYGEQRKWYLEAVKRILGAKKAVFRLVFLRTGEVLEW